MDIRAPLARLLVAAALAAGALAGCHRAKERTKGTASLVDSDRVPIELDQCFPLKVEGRPAVWLTGMVDGTRLEAVLAVTPAPGEKISTLSEMHLDASREYLSSQECSTYDVAIEETGHQINDVSLVRGHARMECRGFRSLWFKIDATFEDCGAHAFEEK